jgi:hypothetical protein
MTIQNTTSFSAANWDGNMNAELLGFAEYGAPGAPMTSDTLPADAADLSPEALMAYCQSRLDSIRSQVEGTLAQQEARNSQTAALQQVLATFNKNSSGIGSNDSARISKCEEMEKALYDLITQLKSSGAPCPELGKLEQAYNDLVYTGSGAKSDLPYVDKDTYPPHEVGPEGDSVIDSQEMSGFIGTLQGCVNDLNSGSELQMIQLQSLMSERQTAISLTTNLVQSLDDALQKVADNIGH